MDERIIRFCIFLLLTVAAARVVEREIRFCILVLLIVAAAAVAEFLYKKMLERAENGSEFWRKTAGFFKISCKTAIIIITVLFVIAFVGGIAIILSFPFIYNS